MTSRIPGRCRGIGSGSGGLWRCSSTDILAPASREMDCHVCNEENRGEWLLFHSLQFFPALQREERKGGDLGAVVLWQDRENVGILWGQNQHITNKLSTCSPHNTQAHIFSTVFPTCNQQIAHKLSTTPHLLFILPTQKSTYYQLKIGSKQHVESGQNVGQRLSGD